MPEWARDLPLAAVVVVGLVIIAREYITKVAAKKGPAPCAHILNEPLKEFMAEFKADQESRRKAWEKDLDERRKESEERLKTNSQMCIALTQMCSLMTETLTRVKDIEKAIK